MILCFYTIQNPFKTQVFRKRAGVESCGSMSATLNSIFQGSPPLCSSLELLIWILQNLIPAPLPRMLPGSIFYLDLFSKRCLEHEISASRGPSQNAPRERFSFRSVLKTMLGAPRVLFNEIYHISFYIPVILI